MCGSDIAAEALHMGYLRRLLGVRQAMAHGTVLLETGERPSVEPPHCSAAGQPAACGVWCQPLAAAAAPANLPLERQSWAAQPAAPLQSIGMPVDQARHASCAWSSSSSQCCAATSMRPRQQRGGPAPPSSRAN